MSDRPTADRIRAYLAGAGWTLGPTGAGAALWQRYGGSIRLPHDMTDWDIDKAVMDIGLAEDRHAGDVHADVLAYNGPAVGGPVRSVPLPLESGCAFPLPSRALIEAQAAEEAAHPMQFVTVNTDVTDEQIAQFQTALADILGKPAAAHSRWDKVRATRMDSPEAQTGYRSAADEHDSERPS